MPIRAPFLRELELQTVPRDLQASYPFAIPALRADGLRLNCNAPVTFFVGENGSGKSTVLEAVAINCGFNPAGGNRNNVYNYQPTESALARYLKLIWNFKMPHGFFLRAESFFNFATHIDELDGGTAAYGGDSLHAQSHGEAFMALFQHRFGRGVYLLDEPEAALSPQKQLAFLIVLNRLIQTGESQFIIATHSPILLSYPGARIYGFNSDGVKDIKYEETEHFQVTRDFLNSRESFYHHLFATDIEA